MGVVDHFSDVCSFTETKKTLISRRKRPLQTVELKVKMDCDGCERKVRNAVCSLRGVTYVNVNRKQSRVTVRGHIEPSTVVKKVKSTGKQAELWPYIPHDLVAFPYVSGVYDKKAPSGYVRFAPQAFPSPSSAFIDNYSWLFNDDNANACAIM